MHIQKNASLCLASVFFMAVGSRANIGGAASAPVGVLLGVLGYAVDTYAACICGQILWVIAEWYRRPLQ